MQKVITVILCIALISIVLVGCSKDKDVNPAREEPANTGEYTSEDETKEEEPQEIEEEKENPQIMQPEPEDETYTQPDNTIAYRYYLIKTNGSGFASPSATMCQSLDEISNYKELISGGYDIGEPSSEWSFEGFIKKYDDKYFEDNVVLFILLDEENSNVVHRVSNVGMEDKDLIVDIVRDNVEEASDKSAQWNIVLELPKTAASAENFVINLL